MLAVVGLRRRYAMCQPRRHFERASRFLASIDAVRAPAVTLSALEPGRVTTVVNHDAKFASVAQSAVGLFEDRKTSVYAKIVLTSDEFYTSAECLVKVWAGLPYAPCSWSIDPTPPFITTLDDGSTTVIFIHDKEGLVTTRMRAELDDMCQSAAANNCELSFVIVESM